MISCDQAWIIDPVGYGPFDKAQDEVGGSVLPARVEMDRPAFNLAPAS